MTPDHTTRRTVLKSTAAVVAGAALPATASAEDGWTAVESPTGNSLYDVEYTAAGAYAVGAGGPVPARTAPRPPADRSPVLAR